MSHKYEKLHNKYKDLELTNMQLEVIATASRGVAIKVRYCQLMGTGNSASATIPTSISTSLARPDIGIIEDMSVTPLELIVPSVHLMRTARK